MGLMKSKWLGYDCVRFVLLLIDRGKSRRKYNALVYITIAPQWMDLWQWEGAHSVSSFAFDIFPIGLVTAASAFVLPQF
jgi:hypothetical protein